MPKLPADFIESTPEWKACFGLIDAAEYLAAYGDHRGPVELIEHESTLVGPPVPRHLRPSEKHRKKHRPL